MIVKNPKYKSLYSSDKRYNIVTGGRGSGKSFEVATWATLLTYEPFITQLYTRYTLTSAEKSIIPEFKEKIDELEVSAAFQVNNKSIQNKVSDSQIWFSGIKTSSGNQTANLKSIKNVTTWILEEAEELVDEDVFNKIDMSVRYKKAPNKVALILNPTTKQHWIWERFFKNTHEHIEIDGIPVPMSTHPQVNHIHTTYLDNLGNLEESFLDNIRAIKKTNPKRYAHEIIGGWRERAEGAVFTNWETGKFPEHLPYIYAMDFGFSNDPTTLVKVATDNDRIYVQQYLYKTGMSYQEVVNAVKEITGGHLVVCDNNEPRLINELRASGIRAEPAQKGKDSVRAGIISMLDYKIVACDSPNLVNELTLYKWADKKSDTPAKGNDHLIDPTRYAFNRLSNRNKFIFV